MGAENILMIVLMIAIFYFLLIRPENNRKKQAEEMRSSIKKGERITTIGGIVGRVVQVNDSTIIIETRDDRGRMEIQKWGVQSTETSEAQSAQRSGGFFGGKKKAEEKPQESEKAEASKKDEPSNFDPDTDFKSK